MTLDSQTTTLPSSSVGMRRFGLSAPYAEVSRPPNSRPASIRSWGSPSSPIAHMTFCTFPDVARPQTLSIACLLDQFSLSGLLIAWTRRPREDIDSLPAVLAQVAQPVLAHLSELDLVAVGIDDRRDERGRAE